jgi:GntR family transcriptional regulator
MDLKVVAGAMPKYRQLLQHLRNQILSGELSSGSQLPTEEEMSHLYGVSRGTVRKAVEQLSMEGLVFTEQGSGTYVRAAHPNAIPFRFGDCLNKEGALFKVVTKEVVPAPLPVAEHLAVPLGEPLIHIARLRMHGDEVVGYSERFLPRSLCPDLLDQDLSQPSIHEAIVGLSELPLLRAVVEIEAQVLSESDARILQAASGTQAIVIKRMTYTAPNRPAVWYRGLYRQEYCVSIHIDALSGGATS